MALARARYDLHRRTRHRIQTDFGVPGRELNPRLSAWWELDFSAFRAELQRTFRRDVRLQDRDEWETFLTGRRAEHERLTAEIVHLETELNDRVYALFDLTADEIRIIEESTRYRYGEA